MYAIIPANEITTRELFVTRAAELGYSIVGSQGTYPDYVLIDQAGNRIRAEAEYHSGNFLDHRHDAAVCDLIICWKHTRIVPLPALELSSGKTYGPGEPGTGEEGINIAAICGTMSQELSSGAQKLIEAAHADSHKMFWEMIGLVERRMHTIMAHRNFTKLLREEKGIALGKNMSPFDLAEMLEGERDFKPELKFRIPNWPKELDHHLRKEFIPIYGTRVRLGENQFDLSVDGLITNTAESLLVFTDSFAGWLADCSQQGEIDGVT